MKGPTPDEDRDLTEGRGCLEADLVAGPDLEDVQRRAATFKRRRALTRGFSASAVIGLAVVLSGAVVGSASENSDTVVSEPATPVVSEPADTVALEPASKSTFRPIRSEWPGTACQPLRGPSKKQIAAAEEIEVVGMAKFSSSYTGGVRTCAERDRLIVFRVENPQFDQVVLEIAERYDIRADIRDAPASYAEMKRISMEAFSRALELRVVDSRVAVVEKFPEGHVRIGIDGDADASRQILKDLDDLPYVQVMWHPPVTLK